MCLATHESSTFIGREHTNEYKRIYHVLQSLQLWEYFESQRLLRGPFAPLQDLFMQTRKKKTRDLQVNQ